MSCVAGALHRWNETAAAERKARILVVVCAVLRMSIDSTCGQQSAMQVEAFDLLYEVDGKVGEELIQALDNGPLNEA